MRILYGVQGTGNGHITRSMQVISFLRKNHEVEVLVSGAQNKLSHLLDPNYRFKGFDLKLRDSGKINYLDTLKSIDYSAFVADVKSIDFSRYDLVISDFEPVTAYGAKLNRVTCIGLSNQNYLMKKTKNPMKKLFLRYFAPSDHTLSISLFPDDEPSNFGPIVDMHLESCSVTDNGFYLVYMPHVGIKQLKHKLHDFDLPEGVTHIRVYHPEVKQYSMKWDRVHFYPIVRSQFVTSLKSCSGIITNAGFSTLSEAVFFGKKIWTIPVKSHFEQKFNAKTMRKNGYFTSKSLNESSFLKWLDHKQPETVRFMNSVYAICECLERFASEKSRNKTV